jgi:hypothetical protein
MPNYLASTRPSFKLEIISPTRTGVSSYDSEDNLVEVNMQGAGQDRKWFANKSDTQESKSNKSSAEADKNEDDNNIVEFDGGRGKILRELKEELEADEVEYGAVHPAEKILQKALDSAPFAVFWVRDLFMDMSYNPAMQADLLKCIGRIEYKYVKSMARSIIESALYNIDIRTRDAAIYAIEQWREKDFIGILEKHLPKETNKRMAEYINKIISYLKKENG